VLEKWGDSLAVFAKVGNLNSCRLLGRSLFYTRQITVVEQDLQMFWAISISPNA